MINVLKIKSIRYITERHGYCQPPKKFFKICPRISANWREYFSFLKVVLEKSAKLVFNWRLFAFIRGQNFLLLGYANFIPLSNVFDM